MTRAGPDFTTAVVITVYNKEEFVAATLASVWSQSFNHLEVIVVDDGSTDGSLARVRESLDGHKATIVSIPNGGVSNARNHGFGLVSGRARYVLFLDADDLLAPNAIQRLVDHLEEHSDAVACYSQVRLVDGLGSPLVEIPDQERWAPAWFGRRAIPPSEPVTPLAAVCSRFWAIPSSCLVRTSVMRTIGPWDPQLCRPTKPYHAEDKDMAIRLALAGPLHRLDAAVVEYRVLPSGHKDAMYEGLRALDEKWWNAPLTPDARRAVRRGIRFDAKVAMLDSLQRARAAARSRSVHHLRTEVRTASRSAARWATTDVRMGLGSRK